MPGFGAVVGKKPREFGERLLVNTALELDYVIELHPIRVPAPGVEFRVRAGPQAHVAIAAHQAQQKPDLLLAAVTTPPFPRDPVRRNVVTQPIPGTPENPDVAWKQTDLFLQLAVHGLLGRLAHFDPALRELPRMFLDSLAPEYLVFRVTQNDADVRAVAVTVQHFKYLSEVQLDTIFSQKRND